jgi:hypothetical protein
MMIGNEIERVADVLEREDPRVIVRHRNQLAPSRRRDGDLFDWVLKVISLIAADCFFQNREHEAALTLERYRFQGHSS